MLANLIASSRPLASAIRQYVLQSACYASLCRQLLPQCHARDTLSVICALTIIDCLDDKIRAVVSGRLHSNGSILQMFSPKHVLQTLQTMFNLIAGKSALLNAAANKLNATGDDTTTHWSRLMAVRLLARCVDADYGCCDVSDDTVESAVRPRTAMIAELNRFEHVQRCVQKLTACATNTAVPVELCCEVCLIIFV